MIYSDTVNRRTLLVGTFDLYSLYVQGSCFSRVACDDTMQYVQMCSTCIETTQ